MLTEAHARKQEPEEKQLFSCIRWFTLTLPLTFLNILCLNYLPSCERIPELAEVNGFFRENEVTDTFCAENTGKRPLLLLSSQVVKFKLKHKDAAIEWGPELVLCKQVNKAIWTFFISLPFLVRDVHEHAWGGAVCVTGHKSIWPFFLSFLLSSNILLSRTLNGKSGEEERDGLTMFHQVHYVWQKTTTSANTLLFSRGNIVSKSCSAKDIAE